MKIENPGQYTVSDGDVADVVGTGEDVIIHQTGSVVMTWGASAPVIHQSGGKVITFNSSAPVIYQSGGEVWALEASAPVIHKI